MNALIQRHLVHRYWSFFLRTFIVLLMVWSFSLGVKFFIRQELFDIRTFLFVIFSSLPSVIPHMACVAAMLMVIHLGDLRELHLSVLLGMKRIQRYLYLWIPMLLLVLVMFAYEGFVKPDIKATAKHPAMKMSDALIQKTMALGPGLQLGEWLISRVSGDKFFIVKESKDKTVMLISESARVAKRSGTPELLMQRGYLWPNISEEKSRIAFREATLPVDAGPRRLGLSELSLLDLLSSSLPGAHNRVHLMLRNCISPLFLVLFGMSVGYFTLITRRGWGYALCMFTLLIVYFPLCVLGKKVGDTTDVQAILTIYSPLLVIGLLAMLLNHFAVKRGMS